MTEKLAAGAAGEPPHFSKIISFKYLFLSYAFLIFVDMVILKFTAIYTKVSQQPLANETHPLDRIMEDETTDNKGEAWR